MTLAATAGGVGVSLQRSLCAVSTLNVLCWLQSSGLQPAAGVWPSKRQDRKCWRISEEMMGAVWQALRLSAAWADGAVAGQRGECPPLAAVGSRGCCVKELLSLIFCSWLNLECSHSAANTQKHINDSPPALSSEIPNDTSCCYLAGTAAAAVRVGATPRAAGLCLAGFFGCRLRTATSKTLSEPGL